MIFERFKDMLLVSPKRLLYIVQRELFALKLLKIWIKMALASLARLGAFLDKLEYFLPQTKFLKYLNVPHTKPLFFEQVFHLRFYFSVLPTFNVKIDLNKNFFFPTDIAISGYIRANYR